MQIPLGCEAASTSNKVCKLWKSLYGHKQSLRAWFERLTRVVKKEGFTQCQSNHTMFVKHSLERKVTDVILIRSGSLGTRHGFE